MTWSDELARGAKSWADYLAENETLEHAPNLQLGENLYQSGKPPPKEPCTEATKLFYGEVKNYDFDKPGFSANTGHFTQVNLLLGIPCHSLLYKSSLQFLQQWPSPIFKEKMPWSRLLIDSI